ncbi:MAG: hypothetical protein KDK02_14235 [Rhodobacteraceae bacterium]|nr:hypothetical protein [Paracoccaceae bacterium]
MRFLAVLLTAAMFIGPMDVGRARSGESVLDSVRDRGFVRCSIGNRLVGDTRIGAEGYEGFFPEFCRVVALAVFGDRNAVQMSPALIRAGLQSISDGEVDVYVSNVTWTFSRDLALGLTPAAVLYHDGQGFKHSPRERSRVRFATWPAPPSASHAPPRPLAICKTISPAMALTGPCRHSNRPRAETMRSSRAGAIC